MFFNVQACLMGPQLGGATRSRYVESRHQNLAVRTDSTAEEMEGMNFVAQLNEFAQKQNQTLTFEKVAVYGPPHNPMFTMKVVLNNEAYPEGEGRNKKEAKQNAAKNALQKLCKESVQLNDSVTSSRECPSPVQGQIRHPNYVCWLNEYGQKQNLSITPKESTNLAAASNSHSCRFIVGDKEFPEAFGKTKKEAKEQAAKLVHQELCTELTTKDQETSDVSVGRMDESSQSISGFFEKKNYKGLLNEYCQKTNSVLIFKVNKSGPPHMPQFSCRAAINNKEYSESQGKSVKEAEQNAAQLALSELHLESDQDSEQLSVIFFPRSKSHNNSTFKIDRDISSDFIIFRDSNNAQSPKHLQPLYLMTNILLILRFLQDYDSVTRIGKGGFGRVFKARRKLEKRYFAVKIVKSTMKALREVNALVDLQHSNIVRYYSCWEEDTEFSIDSLESSSQSDSNSSAKYLYIQMELCDNDNLKVWIDKQNAENKQSRRMEALDVLQQVVEGVKYIHSNRLIHRDLKPPNILLWSDKKVKIGDFGLVTFAEDEADEGLLQRTKQTGTRSYMSPEQKTMRNYDRKVDIFALGLIYFELLWALTTTSEKADVWLQVRNNRFPQGFCEQFSREHKLISRMLSAKPEDRPDASEISKELEKVTALMLCEREVCREIRSF
ncbi:interferon-induced, double-stranded RNA-activated protein kinase-like isoform X1 [Arapaima gigas]